jgi:hypothetical protein
MTSVLPAALFGPAFQNQKPGWSTTNGTCKVLVYKNNCTLIISVTFIFSHL